MGRKFVLDKVRVVENLTSRVHVFVTSAYQKILTNVLMMTTTNTWCRFIADDVLMRKLEGRLI